ncbi:MAG: ABC transporter permease [Lachnospiraceae bacterium]
MSQKAKKFWNIWDKVGILGILLVILIVFGLIDSRIVMPQQLLTALSRSSVSGIAAAGMMFAIVAGGFDLSVGSIVSLVSCVVAVQLTGGRGTFLSILIALAAAAVCGVVNGIIITKLKIQTFVATLATQLAFAGVALVYCNKAIQLTSQVNKGIKFFSTGKLLGVIPVPIVLLVLAYLITYFVYQATSFGTKTRAIGSNEAAARTTGIKVDRTLILVFVVTAVTAGIAGVLNTAQVSTGNPTLGTGFELDAITAVVLGGTALAGGKGNVAGTLIGAILVTFVKMGLNMLGVGEAYQNLAVAIVLLFALTINGIKLIMMKGEE